MKQELHKIDIFPAIFLGYDNNGQIHLECLHGYKKTIIENHCYIEIDPIKTNINSFYTYIENSDAECWRRFIMIGNDSEDFLHVNNTNPEFIRPILTNILGLSSYQTSFKT